MILYFTPTTMATEFLIHNPYRGGHYALKGNLHGHSTNSDGQNSPAEYVQEYLQAGHDFAVITDHNKLTPDPHVSGIIWLGDSVEETFSRHITAYVVGKLSSLSIPQELLDYHSAHHELASLAHPSSWATTITKDEIVRYESLPMMEIFNTLTASNAETLWDTALTAGQKIWGLANDDCHDVHGPYFNKAWNVVLTNEKTAAAIEQSLRTGNFYASTGNDLDIKLKKQTIYATSSEFSTIYFIGQGGQILKTDTKTVEATYYLRGHEQYVRVKSVRDRDGTTAWSNPIFVTPISQKRRPADYSPTT